MAAVDLDILKKYDWGVDRNVLNPIEAVAVKAGTDDAVRGEFEAQLIEILPTNISRDAKDYVCRKLMLVGSAKCVPTVAALLPDAELSHMARFALQQIPGTEAPAALRDSLPKVSNPLKVGVLASLGARGDQESISAIAVYLTDNDGAVASAAAAALGSINSEEAADALIKAKPGNLEVTQAVADARLRAAEKLLADGKKGAALKIYQSLAKGEQTKQVRVAATRGMLACAGKK